MTDLSAEARRLIAAARVGDEPTDADRDRVRAGVMAAVAAPTPPQASQAQAADGGAASGVAGAGGSSLAKLLVVLGIAGAAATGLWWHGLTRAPASTPAPHAAQGAEPAPQAPPELPHGAGAETVAPPAEAPAPPTAATPTGKPGVATSGVATSGVATSGAATSGAATSGAATAGDASSGAATSAAAVPEGNSGDDAPVRPPRPGFDTEISLVGKAQRALAGGDARAALRLVRRHARLFSDGKLVQEREAVRVRALCRSGKASASDARRAFHRRWPSSVYADAISADCDQP